MRALRISRGGRQRTEGAMTTWSATKSRGLTEHAQRQRGGKRQSYKEVTEQTQVQRQAKSGQWLGTMFLRRASAKVAGTPSSQLDQGTTSSFCTRAISQGYPIGKVSLTESYFYSIDITTLLEFRAPLCTAQIPTPLFALSAVVVQSRRAALLPFATPPLHACLPALHTMHLE